MDRYDKNKKLITTQNKRKKVYAAGLSVQGVKFAGANVLERIKLFTDGVDIITKQTASELVEFLYLNDCDIDSIDILEYMYIFSDDRDDISFNDKTRLLLEFRKLSRIEREKIGSLLKLFCNPKNRKPLNNKKLLRDYNNWKNESQQIFGLFANSTYFKVENNKLILNTGDYGLFNAAAKRGEKGKYEYFNRHAAEKSTDFELHHIVPFSKAQTKSDALLIDDFKNLIYLHKRKHEEFTSKQNKNVIFKYEKNNPNVIFLDFKDGFIMVDITKEARFSRRLSESVKLYNNKLLKKFYLYNET